MSKISVTTIAGLTSGGDANTVKIESGDSLNVVSGDLTVDTNVLKVDSSNNKVGIGTTSPTGKLTVDGGFLEVDVSGTQSIRVGSTDHIVGGTDNDAVLQSNTGKNMRFLTGSTERIRLHSGGVVSFNNGIELGSGLDATAANTLDDYEEGTWSPGINYAGNNTNATMSQTSGTYVKIGRQVFCSFMLYIGNKNGGTGDVFLTGLPFTAVDLIANTSIEGNGIISYYYGLSASVHTQSIAVIQSGTTAEIYTGASGTNSTRATVSHYDNSAQIRGSFTYHA